MSEIIVVAVHPDDETLGAGGTLLKLKEEGHKIHWLIVSALVKEKGFTADQIEKRKKEIEKVSAQFNFDSVHELGFPTICLDEVPDSELIGAISKVFNTVKPHTVFLPFHSDVHSDHRKVFNAAYSCTKNFRYPFIKRIFMMETLSETDFVPALAHQYFVPNVFIDITKYIEKKCSILKIFEGELGPAPFPRSLETVQALATYRGSAAGCKSAEAFVLLKEVL
jgi:LmbE family N-acetylglucosaminyl deacetylase